MPNSWKRLTEAKYRPAFSRGSLIEGGRVVVIYATLTLSLCETEHGLRFVRSTSSEYKDA
jgi:hypothetical protein